MSAQNRNFASSPSMRNYTETLSLRVPEDQMDRLETVSQKEGLSLSDTARLVLERGLVASGLEAQKEGAEVWRKRK